MKEAGYDGVFVPKKDNHDGIALFWRKAVFSLMRRRTVDYVNTDSGAFDNQVSLISILIHIKSAKQLAIVVCHLKAGYAFEKTRLRQIASLLREIRVDRHTVQGIVMCGDFNSLPGGDVYPLVRKQFEDVYEKVHSSRGDKAFTTWKIRDGVEGKLEKKCIEDYIFIDQMQVLSLLDMPPEHSIGPTRLPSLLYPSDHLSLFCRLWFM
mmetsp:Transcript_6513/g.10120  ORF Transcript_6513/g.10120 Transcript_6513/m.10120 type:complete len:208 (+) Transcript_6513:307-930(+)